jgi:hypothetical protein
MNNHARTALHWIRTQQREFWLYHGGAFVVGLIVWSGLSAVLLWFVAAGASDIQSVAGRVPPRYGFFILGVLAAVLVGAGLLVKFARMLVRDGLPLIRINAVRCARVIGELASEPMKVSYEELRRRLPGCAVMEAADECLRLPGVIRLEARPPGLSLTEKTRAQLREAA